MVIVKWVYLASWALLALRDLPRLWRAEEKRSLLLGLWLAFAGAGLALAVWYFWGGTGWRLSEWANELLP